jgi:hypothetical protein
MELTGSLPHSCPPPVPIHNHINPVPTSWTSIVILSTQGGHFPSGLPIKNQYAPLLHTCYVIPPIVLYLLTRIPFDKKYRSWSSSLRRFLHSPVTSSPWGRNISLYIRNFNTLNLCSSLKVRDQVSHPYRTGNTRIPKTGKDKGNSGKGKWLLSLDKGNNVLLFVI